MFSLFLPPKTVSAVRLYGDEAVFYASASFLSLPISGRLKKRRPKKHSGRLILSETKEWNNQSELLRTSFFNSSLFRAWKHVDGSARGRFVGWVSDHDEFPLRKTAQAAIIPRRRNIKTGQWQLTDLFSAWRGRAGISAVRLARNYIRRNSKKSVYRIYLFHWRV